MDDIERDLDFLVDNIEGELGSKDVISSVLFTVLPLFCQKKWEIWGALFFLNFCFTKKIERGDC